MIWLSLPWLPVTVLLALLLLLFVREFVLARNYMPGDPERGMSLFNLWVIFFTIVCVVFGTRHLFVHERTFEHMLPPYPHARYAPEREVFHGGAFDSQWIYVSSDELDAIINFYRSTSDKNKIKMITDISATSSPKIMFTDGKKNIFLTIEREKNTSVLFYSEEGEARSVPVSPSGI